VEEIRADIGAEIVKNNLKREYSSLSKYACKSSRGKRLYPEREVIPDRQNIRPSFFHDTDRIIHSRAYTRYIDKTQVFFLFDNDHITHRVLHVQLVSKIARTIGRCLKLNEDLIEAISLGHDLGHVPYGHDGERYLTSICKNYGMNYFCHNAQSVRSLMELENRGKGLNLTLQVLDGILCHNGELLKKVYQPDTEKNWDRFLEEYENCWQIEKFDKTIRPMTLEGCVMRISDVIAYIGRDIEDAVTVKLIERAEIPEDIVAVLGSTNNQIINNLVIDIVNNSYDKDYITFSDQVYDALNKLLKFNYQYIYQNPMKQKQDHKIRHMFEYLFEVYIKELNDCKNNSTVYKWHLDSMDKSYLNNPSYKIVLDFIAGMTDDFFNNEFKKHIIPESFGLTL